MTKVSQQTISDAINNYQVAVGKLTPDLQTVTGTFNEFIGAAPPYSSARVAMNLTTEQADRVNMLLGPDVDALVNVWAIQRKQAREQQDD